MSERSVPAPGTFVNKILRYLTYCFCLKHEKCVKKKTHKTQKSITAFISIYVYHYLIIYVFSYYLVIIYLIIYIDQSKENEHDRCPH